MNNFCDIVRCVYVSEDKFPDFKVSYVDYVEDKPNTDEELSFPTLSLKIFEEKFINKPVKTTSLNDINNLYVDILDTYCGLYEKNNKKCNLTYDVLENNTNKLLNYCYYGINIISSESRRGPGNMIIVPDEKYINIFKNGHNMTVVVNPTDKHKDKIFVVRISKEMSEPGLLLITSKNINSSRYNKLLKILHIMGKSITDLSFDYIIHPVGANVFSQVQIINLINIDK